MDNEKVYMYMLTETGVTALIGKSWRHSYLRFHDYNCGSLMFVNFDGGCG